MSSMIGLKNQAGSINVLLIPLIAVSVLLVGFMGFAVWAFAERQDYKNNSDEKAAAAVKVAEQKLQSELENQFLEREKEPLRDYKGAAVLGSVTFKYPKTWSGYVDESNERLTLLMNPGLVSAEQKTTQALRINVANTIYDSTLKKYDSAVKTGKLRASAFRLEKLPDVLGTRLEGEISNGVQGVVVLLPLRDKTLVISTESPQYVQDFNAIILPNLSYTP